MLDVKLTASILENDYPGASMFADALPAYIDLEGFDLDEMRRKMHEITDKIFDLFLAAQQQDKVECAADEVN